MAKFKVGDAIKRKTLGYVGTVKDVLGGGRYKTFWPCQGWGGVDPGEDLEPVAAAPATATPEVEIEVELTPFPQVGDSVLIPGVISAINHSPRGTNYNIVFETQNRRMSLHFLDEDFILFEDDGSGDCVRANNDNGPVPTGDTAKAFDALSNSIFGLTVRRAA